MVLVLVYPSDCIDPENDYSNNRLQCYCIYIEVSVKSVILRIILMQLDSYWSLYDISTALKTMFCSIILIRRNGTSSGDSIYFTMAR